MSEKINPYGQKAPYSIYPNSIGQIEQARIDFLNEQVQFWHNKYANLEKQIQDKIDELNKQEKELQNGISEEEREEYLDANIGFGLMHIEIQREVLEELLKGE